MAVVQLTDRFLLTKTRAIPNPFSFTFYVGLLGLVALALIPFLIVKDIPIFFGKEQIFIAVISGGVFGIGLVSFYWALRIGEASRVVPITGGLVAVFTFILARIFLGEILGFNEILAFLLLISGGFLISLKLEEKKHIVFKEWALILIAVIFFVLAWILKKYVFLVGAPFLSALVWFGVGGFLFSLFLLIPSKIRKEIFTRTPKIETKNKLLFLGSQGISGLAVFLRNYAVFLGSVTLVNVLEGMQYAFILFFAFILAKRFPQILKEEFRGFVVWQKIIGILLIALGLFLLWVRVLV